MSKVRRWQSTGNWAEDLGRDIQLFLILGLASLVVVPVLLIIIVVLVVF